MSELWRVIKGYEGIYEVSSAGRVRSLGRNVRFGNQSRQVEARVMAEEQHYRGYLRVGLSRKGVTTHHFIHRLVADAFLKNDDNLPVVNHKDRNKKNNDVSNLEWVSYSENSQHYIADDLAKKSISTPQKASKRMKISIEAPADMLEDILKKMA